MQVLRRERRRKKRRILVELVASLFVRALKLVNGGQVNELKTLHANEPREKDKMMMTWLMCCTDILEKAEKANIVLRHRVSLIEFLVCCRRR